METRVLELLHSPDSLVHEDLKLIQKEIGSYPYMQSLRALYLLGIHKYEPELYPQELSLTAAYTTDKKILYNLINKKEYQSQPDSNELHSQEQEIVSVEVETQPVEQTPVDNFSSVENIAEEEKEIETVEVQQEEIIEPEFQNLRSIPEVKEKMEVKQEIDRVWEPLHLTSFPIHEIPQKVESKKEIEIKEAVSSQNEWKPLMATPTSEFSAKSVEKTLISESEQETLEFSWSHLHVPEQNVVSEKVEEVSVVENLQNDLYQKQDLDKWKPLSTTLQQKQEEVEERPVFNVSFFGDSIEEKVENKEVLVEETPVEEEKEIENNQSNVETFINTWQSWLKIDRSEEEKKSKIIDQFIKANPKISQLRDDVDFIVKEKGDDLSHLMTETLAKLYWEQKLYTKAIKAYEALIEKHPEKKDAYKESISLIKDQKLGK